MSLQDEFNLQTYLMDLDHRLTAGIDRVNTQLSNLSRRLVRTETTVKWISRIFVPTFLGITGWGFWSLAHAVFAQAATAK